MQAQVETIDRRTYSIEEYAAMYGLGRTHTYMLARRNELTVPVIRLGRRLVVSRAAVEADLARM